MTKSIFFKQSKPSTVIILGTSIIALALFLVYEGTASLSQILTMIVLGLLLLGYSISYEFDSNLSHKRHIKLFGVSIFRSKLECIFPEYITVFLAVFKKGSDWGPVSAMGKETRDGKYVIRFFKGNTHFTVWKTNSLPIAVSRAAKLGELINVKVLDKNM